uniref:Immunoglobulin superfamily member 6 n=1 Tax=Coturnix japonica TaxID=93934 RepID=A0A8C2TYE9_COTJA
TGHFNRAFKIRHVKTNTLCATGSCHVTVTQPRFQEAEHSAHTALLPCAFSAHGCFPAQPQVLWFRFFTDRHEDLCTPDCTNRQKFQVHSSSENNHSLQINNLTVNDSALYFCGIAFANSGSPHSKQTGDGTVLTKRGQFMLLPTSAVKISSGRKIFRAIAQELQKQQHAQHCHQPVSVCSSHVDKHIHKLLYILYVYIHTAR